MARRSGSGPASSGRPSGRPVTVVTGAGSGIGRAATLRLSQRGDAVLAIGRDAGRLEQLSREVRKAGGQILTWPADVLDAEALVGACDAARDAYGPVRYAFSNARDDRRVPMLQMSREDWDVVIRPHLTGAFNLCRAVLPQMVAGGGGALLLMASDFAITGLRGQANYAAAKAGTYSLAKSLAIEFAGAGIRVNAVGPGPIDTTLLRAGRTGDAWDEAMRNFDARVPMGRLGTPDEVAGTVDFLLSDRSSYVTGQILQPNGGQVMW